MFKRASHGLLAAMVLLAASSIVHGNVSFSIPDGSVNKTGQPVSARADFQIKPDLVIVRLTNTTSPIASLNQALAGLSFQVLNQKAKGQLGTTAGRVRVITATGATTTPNDVATDWTLTTEGNTYRLRAPGERNLLLPAEATPRWEDINGGQSKQEMLVGTCTFEIVIPGIGLTDDLVGVRFVWRDQLGDGILEPGKVTSPSGAPDPSRMGGAEIGIPGEEIAYVPSREGINDVLNPQTFGYRDTVGEAGYVPHTVGSGGGIDGPDSPSSTPRIYSPIPGEGDGSGGDGGNGNNGNPDGGDGFTLTPTKTSPNGPLPAPVPVPEPATLALLGVAGLGLVAARKR